MRSVYFFEIPVYRLSEKEYYKQREDHVASIRLKFQGMPLQKALESQRAELEEGRDVGIYAALCDSYGGCWDFNEIIGYIRLYFDWPQVLGKYFAVDKKRIVRTRTRQFVEKTHKLVYESSLRPPYTNAGIYVEILEYLERCKREVPLRFIDTSKFELVGPHVDWIGLIKSSGVQDPGLTI
jgi:hypothetical protein